MEGGLDEPYKLSFAAVMKGRGERKENLKPGQTITVDFTFDSSGHRPSAG
jgi:hypothetical protein